MKRKVLGRGIEAIITNKPAYEKEGGFTEIDVDNIYPNPHQPRKKFSIEKIKELAASIKESGLIQPVVVYKENEKYFLLVGERRWRASQYLKWKKIPAIIKETSAQDTIISALVENIQREDLNAIEIAEGIELMMKQTVLSQEQTSEKLGMNRSTLTNYLRLLKLPEAVKQSIISGHISQGHARALLALEDKNDILIALSTILQNKLSVRQTEAYVKRFSKQKKTEKILQDPDLVKTEQKMARLLSTRVKLKYAKNGSGRIEIFFSSVDDFQRVYDIIFKMNSGFVNTDTEADTGLESDTDSDTDWDIEGHADSNSITDSGKDGTGTTGVHGEMNEEINKEDGYAYEEDRFRIENGAEDEEEEEENESEELTEYDLENGSSAI